MNPNAALAMQQAIRLMMREKGHAMEVYPLGTNLTGDWGVRLSCDTCQESWAITLVSNDAVKSVKLVMSTVPDCRGKPLYTRIEGTPWFQYASLFLFFLLGCGAFPLEPPALLTTGEVCSEDRECASGHCTPERRCGQEVPCGTVADCPDRQCCMASTCTPEGGTRLGILCRPPAFFCTDGAQCTSGACEGSLCR